MRAYLTIEGAGKRAMKIQERLLSFLSCMVQYFLLIVPHETGVRERLGSLSIPGNCESLCFMEIV